MKSDSSMQNVIPGFVVAITLIFTSIAYPALPEVIVTHWGPDGQPDGFSPRTTGAWMLPLMMLVIWGLMRFLPRIDPRRENYKRFSGTYSTLVSVAIAFMGVIQVAVVGSALGWPIAVPNIVIGGVGFLFIIIGNLLPRVKSNWFIGIRLPWTLSSENVWTRTHRLGGLMFMLGGIVLVAAAFSPERFMTPALVLAISLCSVVPIVYSLVLWQREKRAEQDSATG